MWDVVGNTTFSALGSKEGWLDSPVTQKTYLVQARAARPEFDGAWDCDTFVGAVNVTITSETRVR